MKNWHIILLIFIFVLVLFGAVYCFTREAVFESWGLSSTGQIGDTIGGITGPIINIAGAFLIFITFLQQNSANRIASEHNSFALLHDLYKDVKEDFKALTFSSLKVKDGRSYYGKRGLSVFSKTLQKNINSSGFAKNSFFNEFNFLLASLVILLDLVDSSTVSDTGKKVILRLVHTFYHTRISKHIDDIIDATVNYPVHEEFNGYLSNFRNKIEENYRRNLGNRVHKRMDEPKDR